MMKKIRTLGLVFSVVALAAFSMACSNPSGPGNNQTITTVRPGNPDVGNLPGGDAVGTSLYDQINWVREHYMLDTHYYAGFTVRANYDNEELDGQLDLNFSRPVTITMLPAAGHTGARTIEGHSGCTLSTIVVRSGNRLIMQDIILQERASLPGVPDRSNSLITVLANAGLEMTGLSEITGGQRRGVVVAGNSSLIMRDSARIHNNAHTGDGSGVQLSGIDATLRMYDNASIDFNSTSGRGAGVNAHNGAVIIMRGSSEIHNNSTTGNGGGVALTAAGSRLSIYDIASIHTNTAGNNGGGVFMDSNAPFGGIGHTIIGAARITGNTAVTLGDEVHSSGQGNTW